MLQTISNYLPSKDKSFVNYPSIMVDQFYFNQRDYKDNSSTFQIITTGRLYYQKGYLFALNAMLMLKKDGYKFKYHVLGEGPDREMLEFVIHDMGLTDFVYLHGRVNGDIVLNHLNKSDIFLLPSIYEGIANAALEAMSVGLPIVSTTAGGMAEVISDGVNGKLVPTYYSQAIYEALKWTFDNYNVSKQMAIKARETIESKYTHEHQIDVYLNNYRKILT
jgi:colanic acid/amylovoran biosynthesis glycosyltransferase